MITGLKGNQLPESHADFKLLINSLGERWLNCQSCRRLFTDENTRSKLGWRETQISGFCENCFDGLFKELA